MKRIITLCSAMFLLASLWAQSPETMNYQAVVRDAGNKLVVNKTVGMQISIVQGSPDGTAVYTETLAPVANANGLVSVEIGSGTSADTFSSIDWANGPFFIKTETDPAGGTNYSITGISQLLSVPYALHAKTAETLTGTLPESDPLFSSSVAHAIKAEDTLSWNRVSVLDSIITAVLPNKMDTVVIASFDTIVSVTSKIDTVVSITSQKDTVFSFRTDSVRIFERDSAFERSAAGTIAAEDIERWNNKLSEEQDGDPTNELQMLRISNDTIYLSNGGFVKLPAVETFSGNYNDLTDAPNMKDYAEQDALDFHVERIYKKLKAVPAGMTAAQAAAITANSGKDTTGIYHANRSALDAVSGINTGDQDLSSLVPKTALADSMNKLRNEFPDVSGTAINAQAIQDTASQIRADIPDVSGFISAETDPSVPTGIQIGDMQYWNGTAWVTVEAGNDGDILKFESGKPTWVFIPETITHNGLEYKTVKSTTGKIWLDRNLGAAQVATSSTDAAAYGDLYQWGRAADGHQIRTSGTTATLATSNTPGHGNFITNGSSPYDWRNPQNDNLWQGVSGTNNPCPNGYRLPTETEWDAERQSWSNSNAAGALASPLKLPVAGRRSNSNGTLYSVGSDGFYWSGTVDGAYASGLYFGSSTALVGSSNRAGGFSVRCLKD